jgi:hypothetical protein
MTPPCALKHPASLGRFDGIGNLAKGKARRS